MITVTTDENGVKIYAKEKESSKGTKYTLYWMSVSSRDAAGNWHNGLVDVTFKKDVSVPNKSTIVIKNAMYIVNEYNGKTYTKLLILDFTIKEPGEVKPNKPTTDAQASDFMNIPDGMEAELPFT